MDVPRIELYPGPDERDGWRVETPYSDAWREEMKAQVPSRDRRWGHLGKFWWIAAEHFDLLAYLLIRHFGGYELVDDDTGEITYVDHEGARCMQGRLL